jgi:subtilase family protein
LLEDGNRFFEPAGAISHGEGVDATLAEDVRARPITVHHEPSPFSRVGPGIGGSVKPDLVDVGGTMVFDPIVVRLRTGEDLASAGVLTLHNKFIDRLFTAGSGTSYAAPRVAFSAAQILTRFPSATANLVRALLGSAEIPGPARERLIPLGIEAVQTVCGHGQTDLERAAFSDEARVVLYGEDELVVDHFAVYRVPIPQPFQSHAGDRKIQVTLAFDPPVRHTRNDYAGIGMSFRLIRGCDPQQIFEHYRKRSKEEGPFPEIEARYDCKLLPGAQAREKGTIHRATALFNDPSKYTETNTTWSSDAKVVGPASI